MRKLTFKVKLKATKRQQQIQRDIGKLIYTLFNFIKFEHSY